MECGSGKSEQRSRPGATQLSSLTDPQLALGTSRARKSPIARNQLLLLVLALLYLHPSRLAAQRPLLQVHRRTRAHIAHPHITTLASQLFILIQHLQTTPLHLLSPPNGGSGPHSHHSHPVVVEPAHPSGLLFGPGSVSAAIISNRLHSQCSRHPLSQRLRNIHLVFVIIIVLYCCTDSTTSYTHLLQSFQWHCSGAVSDFPNHADTDKHPGCLPAKVYVARKPPHEQPADTGQLTAGFQAHLPPTKQSQQEQLQRSKGQRHPGAHQPR